MWSTVAAVLARTEGWRKVAGETIVPTAGQASRMPRRREHCFRVRALAELQREERDRSQGAHDDDQRCSHEAGRDQLDLPRRQRPEECGDAELAELPAAEHEPRGAERRDEPSCRDEPDVRTLLDCLTHLETRVASGA